MGENKCYKCFTNYPPDNKSLIICELCSKSTCKPCTELCPTEIRVVELQQRNLIYACPECRSKGKGKTKTDTAKESNIIRELGDLLRKSLKDLETKICNLDKDKTQQMKNLQRVLEQKTNEQDQYVEQKIKLMASQYEDAMKKLTMEMKSSFSQSKTTKITESTKSVPERPVPARIQTITKSLQPSYANVCMEKQQRNIMEQIIHLNSDKPQTTLGESNEHKNYKGKNSTSVPKPIQVQQKEDIDEEQYAVVKRRREQRQDRIDNGREYQRNSLQTQRRQMKNRGTAEDNFNKEDDSERENKKIWLFISKAKDHVTNERLLNYIASKTNMAKETIHVKKIQTWHKRKNNNCFLVGVDPTLKELMYTSDFWPKGLVYSRFDFRKGQHFLDNHRKIETTYQEQEVSDF